MKKTARELVIQKLKKKAEADTSFENLVDALSGLNNSRKNQLLTAVKNQHKEHVGRLVLSAMKAFLRQEAKDATDAVLSDGVLSTAELEEIFK